MATISDVAALAGVSCMTVSRVINQKGYISEETRDAVLRAVATLDYRPNLIARTLASGSSGTLGLLLTHIKNPIYARYTDALSQAIQASGREMILYMANDEASVQNGVETLLSKQVDGIFVLPIELSDVNNAEEGYKNVLSMLYSQAYAAQKPFVFIGPFADGDNNCIYEDYTAGAYIATKHLIELGHKDIAFMTGTSIGGFPWADREAGYKKALEESGIPFDRNRIIQAWPDILQAKEEMLKWICAHKNSMPTAIYCASDILAVGAVHAFVRAGYDVPRDVSIVGHDDGPYAKSCYPQLSTVSIFPKETANQAAALMLSILEGKKQATGNRLAMPAKMVPRDSSAPPA